MKIAELLPADEPLARWLLVLTLARNDLSLTRKQFVAALKEEDGTALHWSRLLAGHLYEFAKFLRAAAPQPEVVTFVDRLPADVRDAYGQLLQPDFLKRVLGSDRNLVFHYPSIDLARRGGAPLSEALRDVRELPAAFKVTEDEEGRRDIRFTFADQVAVQFALTSFGSAGEEQHQAIIKLREHAERSRFFVNGVFHHYCQQRGLEYGEAKAPD